VSCTSLSNDSVPSALLQTDVLSDYAICDQALSLPICAVQCAHSAPYVSVILKFTIKGKYSVSTQDSKNSALISSRIHILFSLLVLELNIILSLTKDEVCVLQNCYVCACGGVAAPSTKVWPPSAAEVQKITYWAQPPKMRHVKILLATFLFITAAHCCCFL